MKLSASNKGLSGVNPYFGALSALDNRTSSSVSTVSCSLPRFQSGRLYITSVNNMMRNCSVFCFDGQFYKVTASVRVCHHLQCSLTSSRKTEKMATDRVTCMPLCSSFYVRDTIIIIWPHKPEKLMPFLDHLSITVRTSAQQ